MKAESQVTGIGGCRTQSCNGLRRYCATQSKLLARAFFGFFFLVLNVSCAPVEDQSLAGLSEHPVQVTSLEVFERQNPECEIWTNWQKTCSRIGESGEVLCKSAAVSVDYSEPICLGSSNKSYMAIVDEYNLAQRASFNRFCKDFTADSKDSVAQCRRWESERPFNGLDLAERKHPWCKRWALSVSPNVNPELSRRLGYYCAARAIPNWCRRASGLGNGPQDGGPVNSDPEAIVMLIPPIDPAAKAVNIPYCQKRNPDA